MELDCELVKPRTNVCIRGKLRLALACWIFYAISSVNRSIQEEDTARIQELGIDSAFHVGPAEERQTVRMELYAVHASIGQSIYQILTATQYIAVVWRNLPISAR